MEQLPQQATVALPDKAGSFKCLFQENAGVIQIISTFKINKKMFLPDEYDQLKAVSYTHLRAHETELALVCRLPLEKKKNNLI